MIGTHKDIYIRNTILIKRMIWMFQLKVIFIVNIESIEISNHILLKVWI